MKREVISAVIAVLLLALAPFACRSSDRGEREVPAMLRYQFQTQMKTILRDVKVAEEQAGILDGKYLELSQLRPKYFNRTVPDNYTLSISDVSEVGFRAEVVHKASGLSCELVVGASGAGIPECDS